MKRLILFGVLFTLTLFFSCSEEETKDLKGGEKSNTKIFEREEQNEDYELLSFEGVEFLESKSWLEENSFFQNNFTCNELYRVTSKVDNKSYLGLDLYLENCSLDNYKVKNYVIIHELPENKKFVYLQRDIIKGNSLIVQFLDITNGNVMEYYLYNCEEEDYLVYQNRIKEIGGIGTEKKHPCYKSFRSCYNRTKAGLVQGPIDEVMCEWLPCATSAYAFCALAYFDGYIATASDFDPNNCTVIH